MQIYIIPSRNYKLRYKLRCLLYRSEEWAHIVWSVSPAQVKIPAHFQLLPLVFQKWLEIGLDLDIYLSGMFFASFICLNLYRSKHAVISSQPSILNLYSNVRKYLSLLLKQSEKQSYLHIDFKRNQAAIKKKLWPLCVAGPLPASLRH